MRIWYIKKLGKVSGPFTAEEIRQMLHEHRLNLDSLIRKRRDGEWMKYHEMRHYFEQNREMQLPRVIRTTPETQKNQNQPPLEIQEEQLLYPESGSNHIRYVILCGFFLIPVLLFSLILVLNTARKGDQTRTESRKPENPKSKNVQKDSTTEIANKDTTSDSARKLVEPLDSEQLVKDVERNIAIVQGKTGSGTCFVIDTNIVATNKHVIDKEFIESIRIVFPSETGEDRGPFKTNLLYEDPGLDLAFLTLDLKSKKPLSLDGNYRLRKGQDVMIIGNPGSDLTDENKVLENVVAKGVMSTETIIKGVPYYQVSIFANHGNSGGPIIDKQGSVLGALTLGEGDKSGLVYCIPASEIAHSISKAKKIGDSARLNLAKQHNIRAVFSTLEKVISTNLEIMRIYQQAMQMSVDKGGTPSDGLESVRKVVKDYFIKYQALYSDQLNERLSDFIDDSDIESNTRSKLLDFYRVYRKSKEDVENPVSNLRAFTEKLNNYSDEFISTDKTLRVLLKLDDIE